LLFSSLSFFIQSNSVPFGEKIVCYASHFPDHSIPYERWLAFLFEQIPINSKVTPFILATGCARSFQFESPEREATVFRDLFLLHFGAMVCPEASEGPGAIAIARSLRNVVIDFADAGDDDIVWLAERCSELALELPRQSLALWIATFPIEGCGAKLMYSIGTRVCMTLLQESSDGFPTMDQFAATLEALRSLCSSGNDDDLLCASVIAAVLEKVVAVAIRLRITNRATIETIARDLRVAFASSDISEMTALKEQFHVTRA
jgi:hypothetical protein